MIYITVYITVNYITPTITLSPCHPYTPSITLQEVVADDTPAIEVVLQADKKRLDLLKEKDQLEADMKRKNKVVDMDRLQDVYEELKAIGADKAEPKARR